MEEKKVPQEIEAEIAVLGSIFMEPNLILQVDLAIDDFYDSRNKLIYKAMKKLSEESKDIAIDAGLVASELERDNMLEQAGGYEYISIISEHGYSTDNLDIYVDLIQKASYRRTVIKELESLYQEGYDSKTPTDEYLNNVEQRIMGIYKNRKAEKFVGIKDVTEYVKEQTGKRADHNVEIVGLDTGFSKLNMYTQGFQNGALIILAARPAMGKTAFALNLAYNIAKNNDNKKIAIFSLEMPSEQLVERMIAFNASINLRNIKNGRVANEDRGWPRFNTACSDLSKLDIYFDDSSDKTMAKIKTKCRKLKAEEGLDFILIDYLQLLSSDKDNDRLSEYEKVSRISRALKLLAVELEIPVLALSQLSRDVEKREDKKPIMSDLRSSGSIEQDADIVMFLYRDEVYNKNSEHKNEAELIIGKNRSGSIGSCEFYFTGETQKFKSKD